MPDELKHKIKVLKRALKDSCQTEDYEEAEALYDNYVAKAEKDIYETETCDIVLVKVGCLDVVEIAIRNDTVILDRSIMCRKCNSCHDFRINRVNLSFICNACFHEQKIISGFSLIRNKDFVILTEKGVVK